MPKTTNTNIELFFTNHDFDFNLAFIFKVNWLMNKVNENLDLTLSLSESSQKQQLNI